MTLRCTFGVDPGLSGAICLLKDGEPAAVWDMPTLQRGDWREVDAGALAIIIRECRQSNPGAYFSACIEKVGARPGDGGTSAFRFGQSFGKIEAVFECLTISYELAIPAVWKRRFGLIGAEKDASRQLAITRFPGMANYLKRKKDDGRAESMLIGLYMEHTSYGR